MQTKTVRISDLQPAAWNPRVDLQPGDPQFEKLRRSVEEFGLVAPLVVNERTGHVVGGHQRLKVLKELGYETADVVFVDLPIEREKLLCIALNQIDGVLFQFSAYLELVAVQVIDTLVDSKGSADRRASGTVGFRDAEHSLTDDDCRRGRLGES